MIRSLAPLAGLAAVLTLAACQQAEPETSETAPVADPVITDPNLTIPPEEATAPPPVGAVTAPGAPDAPTPVLPPEEGAAPSPADSPPSPDA